MARNQRPNTRVPSDEEGNVYSPDADLVNSDWTKQAWDLPPYKSADFMAQVPDLDAFRKTPCYLHACNNGLICDDEWVADWAVPKKPRSKRVQVHIH